MRDIKKERKKKKKKKETRRNNLSPWLRLENKKCTRSFITDRFARYANLENAILIERDLFRFYFVFYFFFYYLVFSFFFFFLIFQRTYNIGNERRIWKKNEKKFFQDFSEKSKVFPDFARSNALKEQQKKRNRSNGIDSRRNKMYVIWKTREKKENIYIYERWSTDTRRWI